MYIHVSLEIFTHTYQHIYMYLYPCPYRCMCLCLCLCLYNNTIKQQCPLYSTPSRFRSHHPSVSMCLSASLSVSVSVSVYVSVCGLTLYSHPTARPFLSTHTPTLTCCSETRRPTPELPYLVSLGASSEGLGVYGWEICLLWVRGFVLFTGCGGCGTFVCETWHESWRELVCSVSWCWYESCLCVRQDTSHELNHFVSVHMVVLTWNILCETWHKSSIRDMTHYIDMTHSYVTWLVNIDVTHYYMTCVIHMRHDMRHSLVRHDVSHDYDIWDIPRARHDSFMFNAVSFHAGMGWLRLVGSFKL